MKSSIDIAGSGHESAREAGAVHPAERSSLADGPMTFTILHDFPPPALELGWRDLLSQVAIPSHYTSPEFFREPYFKERRPFAILVSGQGTVVGVLTGLHDREEVSSGLPTRPQIQIHPGADQAAVIAVFTLGLKEEAKGAKLVSIYSWEWLPLDPIGRHHYRKRIVGGNPVLDLKLGADVLLKQCNGKRRNCIRYAIKQGVEVYEAESPEDYAGFYKIYSSWCAQKNIPCESQEIEDRAFRATKSNRRLLLARHSGKIIAGSVFRFFPEGLVEYSRNSSLPESQNLKPNDLLVWRAIEWACEQRFSKFSMGGSHRFLREFGGQTVPITRYRWDRTMLRRHDRRELLTDLGRELAAKLPSEWENKIRRILGKEVPAGW